MKAGVGGSEVFVFSQRVIETEPGPNEKHLCLEKDSRGFLTGVLYCFLIFLGACKQTYHLG